MAKHTHITRYAIDDTVHTLWGAGRVVSILIARYGIEYNIRLAATYAHDISASEAALDKWAVLKAKTEKQS